MQVRVVVLLILFLALSFLAETQQQAFAGWEALFREAEAAFNSRYQNSCVPLFQDLINRIEAEKSKRPLTEQESGLLERSLDYLGQNYFNNNQIEEASRWLLKLIQLNPKYQMNEDLVSPKTIELFSQLKQQNLGTLSITSVPKGAVVRIDGERKGTADLEIAVVKGSHVVEASKPGYRIQRKDVTVTAGSKVQLPFQLEESAEGLQAYMEAVGRIKRFDFAAAQESLQKAAAEYPDDPLVHSAFAETWSLQGFDEKAREEAKKALDLSADSYEEDRLWVEARIREAMNEWDRAVEISQKLFALHPDDLEVGLRLAADQIRSGKPQEALETLGSLRTMEAPLPDDPRIDLLEAEAAGLMSDPLRQLAAASKAAEKAQGQKAPMLIAKAFWIQGNAQLSLEKPEMAKRALDEARKLYEAANDRFGQALVKMSFGDLIQGKDPEGAGRQYEEALATFREIGNDANTALALYRLGRTSDLQMDANAATKRYEEALTILRRVQNRYAIAQVQIFLGESLMDQLDKAAARSAFEEARIISADVADKAGRAKALNGLGSVSLADKDPDGAEKNYREALDIAQGIGERDIETRALLGLGDVSIAGGNSEGGKKKYEEALGIVRQTGNKRLTAIALYKLGSVLSDQKEESGARARFEEALTLFREIGDKRNTARVQVGLDQILDALKQRAIVLQQQGYELLNQKDYTAAEEKYSQALAICRDIKDKSNQVGALLNLGFLLNLRKDSEGSRKAFEEALQISQEIGEKRSQAMALWNLSVIAFNQGDRSAATNYCDQSRTIFTEIGETPKQCNW